MTLRDLEISKFKESDNQAKKWRMYVRTQNEKDAPEEIELKSMEDSDKHTQEDCVLVLRRKTKANSKSSSENLTDEF